MAKTIFSALRDHLNYPLKAGFLENVLIERGLNGKHKFTAAIAKSNAYRGAVADCITGLILSPDMAEGDMRFDLTYKDMMLKKANSIYASIGEGLIDAADKPIVYIES